MVASDSISRLWLDIFYISGLLMIATALTGTMVTYNLVNKQPGGQRSTDELRNLKASIRQTKRWNPFSTYGTRCRLLILLLLCVPAAISGYLYVRHENWLRVHTMVHEVNHGR
jgi:hypothetical protein